ncbi:uncharacterized protein LOC143912915 [Arctopsyche grandis]|uniref:uncharacterized protein LOC143912915 n=1 Tax=Arctopsyche grandis TaxID=121162 RepID=UPI00406D7495
MIAERGDCMAMVSRAKTTTDSWEGDRLPVRPPIQPSPQTRYVEQDWLAHSTSNFWHTSKSNIRPFALLIWKIVRNCLRCNFVKSKNIISLSANNRYKLVITVYV